MKKIICGKCGKLWNLQDCYEEITVCPSCCQYETMMRATREFPAWKEEYIKRKK